MYAKDLLSDASFIFYLLIPICTVIQASEDLASEMAIGVTDVGFPSPLWGQTEQEQLEGNDLFVTVKPVTVEKWQGSVTFQALLSRVTLLWKAPFLRPNNETAEVTACL